MKIIIVALLLVISMCYNFVNYLTCTIPGVLYYTPFLNLQHYHVLFFIMIMLMLHRLPSGLEMRCTFHVQYFYFPVLQVLTQGWISSSSQAEWDTFACDPNIICK